MPAMFTVRINALFSSKLLQVVTVSEQQQWPKQMVMETFVLLLRLRLNIMMNFIDFMLVSINKCYHTAIITPSNSHRDVGIEDEFRHL